MFFFSEKKNKALLILKGISPFKLHTIIFFSENLRTNLDSPVNLGRVGLP